MDTAPATLARLLVWGLGVDLGLLFGALFALLGIGLLWWGVLALRDGERRPGVVCTLVGLALVAGALSLFGVI